MNVVEIDVGGAEPLVLDGMREVPAQSRDPDLLVELNSTALRDTGSSAEKLLARLEQLRFNVAERLEEEKGPDGRLLLCNLHGRPMP